MPAIEQQVTPVPPRIPFSQGFPAKTPDSFRPAIAASNCS